MKICKHAGLLAASFLLLWANSWADTVELPLTDDAYINGIKPDLRYGTLANIDVHSIGPKNGLVRFDAASIAGQQVSTATLTLYLNSLKRNGTISVHAITLGWNEATVTWNSRPSAETMATAIVELTTGDVGGVIAIDVTAAVQRWADGSLSDAGFLMVTSEGITAIFDAKEMAGGVAATLTVETAAAFTGEPIVLDLNSMCGEENPIDEPGLYVLDRDWRSSEFYPSPDSLPHYNTGCREIYITNNITLDLRGFTIEVDTEIEANYLINIVGDSVRVTLSNGTLSPDSLAIGVFDGAQVTIDNLTITQGFGSGFGSNAKIMNSFLVGENHGIGSNSLIMNSRIRGGSQQGQCLSASGSSVVIQNNVFECSTLELDLSQLTDSTFSGNVLKDESIDEDRFDLLIGGARNIVSSNVFQPVHFPGNIIVNGTANIIDGNIVTNGGIEFRQPGNFFGNNRVKGSFSGTASQTDWGGNVSY